MLRVISQEPGRFFFSLALVALGFAVFFILLKRPKSEFPPTWGQAMLAATGVFAMMMLAYGVVPHEWLTWADSNLGLREDKIMLDTYPIKVSGRAVRDFVVSGIYIVFLALNVVVWVMWHKRGQVKPAKPVASTPVPAGTSAFSRPVTKRD